ncbi:MAG TPA: prolyl oligopeptidase family serine peptidase [Bacillales bacterium]
METRIENVVENYHGTSVSDPYRWLENPETEESKQWGEEQQQITSEYLSLISARDQIRERLTELWNSPKYFLPQKEGEYIYFSKNDGLQNQAVLYRQRADHSAKPEVVLDPNRLNEKGTSALVHLSFSRDSLKMAYAISIDGSDWQEIKIRNLETGKDYAEVIRWSKFSTIAWAGNEGFYYSRFPEPGTVGAEDESHYNRVYWHTLGTPQSDDKLIFEEPENKELAFRPIMSDDDRYLILHVWRGTEAKSRIYFQDLQDQGEFVRLLNDGDANYSFIGNDGSLFYFYTNLQAQKGRVITIDIERPNREDWKEIIPERKDVISLVAMIDRHIVVSYLRHASHELKVYSLEGAFEKDIPLPELGSITGLSGKRKGTEMFVSFTSFLYPQTIFHYSFEEGKLTRFFDSEIAFPLEKYETTQVFYPSKDGTAIPMFITHKKGLALDGNNPVLLTGYGGFNVSETPAFSPSQLMWLENGGVFALANLRGGGEYGETWHQEGMLENKQNVFDDFIAAAEWLIENRYTNRSKLSIMGGSNGGLLVSACMVQRPELFGAVICRVPVTDMLRYHKFTVGRFWTSEYGNAEENPDHFQFLYAYSPLHNVKSNTEYPPTLITTADTDDRVVPAHAKKLTATLQAAQKGDHPILLRIEKNAGHGLGKPTSKLIDEQADIFAFLYQHLGVDS